MVPRFAWLLLTIAVQAGRPPAFFQSSDSPAAMRGKQAVVATSAGTFVIQLLPEAAPTHVAFFMKEARDGTLAGTVFHHVVPNGIIQGGDPISRDPARTAEYGEGGLHQLKAETSAEKNTAGAVSTVVLPGEPDSGGAQFFVCVGDQPGLDGQYTVFGRVVEGLDVVRKISSVDRDANGRPLSRVEITSVTIRDTPVDPFVTDTPAELNGRHVVLETTMGSIELEMMADKAPETVRNFLQLSAAGVYDQTLVHRVSPNFVIQTGAISFRQTRLTSAQQRLVHTLQPEFNDTPIVPGIVSMARGDDPASASTSFFICTGACHSLDGKYTVFARVIAGMDVLNAIAAVQVNGETPLTPILVTRARVETK